MSAAGLMTLDADLPYIRQEETKGRKLLLMTFCAVYRSFYVRISVLYIHSFSFFLRSPSIYRTFRVLPENASSSSSSNRAGNIPAKRIYAISFFSLCPSLPLDIFNFDPHHMFFQDYYINRWITRVVCGRRGGQTRLNTRHCARAREEPRAIEQGWKSGLKGISTWKPRKGYR